MATPIHTFGQWVKAKNGFCVSQEPRADIVFLHPVKRQGESKISMVKRWLLETNQK